MLFLIADVFNQSLLVFMAMGECTISILPMIEARKDVLTFDPCK